MLWFRSSLSGCKTITITGFPPIYTYAQLFPSKLIVFEVTNFARVPYKVIAMFSLDFINNYASLK